MSNVFSMRNICVQKYELMNEQTSQISITKSLNVKFIMYQLSHKHIYCKKNCLIPCLNQKEINSKYYNLINFRGGLETKFGLNKL
jgi:hypothetical protein